MSHLALQLIAENKRFRAVGLDLGNCGLSEIPAEIGELVWLEFFSLAREWKEWDGLGWQSKQSQNVGRRNNRSIDIGPLAGLSNLRVVIVPKVADLTPLAGLSRLQKLCTGGSMRSDLRPLANLTGLEELSISGVGSLAPLAKLSGLQRLHVWGREVTDLPSLSNLSALHTVTVSDAGISDLTPLARLSGLETLNVSRNPQITDLAPLAGLTALNTLNVSDTKVTDLAPLAGLSVLRSLDISDTPVTDLAPLAGLSALQMITASNTKITDLAGLATLASLHALNVSGTKITDLAPLAGLSALQSLNASDTQITNIVPIANQATLQTLNISDTKITDLTPLAGLSALETLNISGIGTTYFAPLAGLSALQVLTASKTQITDLRPLAGLSTLRTLDVSETKINGLGLLIDLSALQTLDVAGTEVVDLAPLGELSALRTLNLSGTKITDLTRLAGLSRLQTLDVTRTEVTDLAPLAGLSALRTLNVSNTKITNFTVLVRLSALQKLDVSQTTIADLAPLATLTALQNLSAYATQISDLAPLAGLSALQEFNAFRTEISDLVPLAGLSALQRLQLSSTQVTDLAPLAALSSLFWLDVAQTRVTDLAPLVGLSCLRVLDVAQTRVTDLAPLVGLYDLGMLNITQTQVTDLAPLAGLSSLFWLDASQTRVTDLAPLAELSLLHSLNVSQTETTSLFTLVPLIRRGCPVHWSSWSGGGIYVKDCPLSNPPPEIVDQGNDAILNYFDERNRGGVDHLYEAKMLIVGEGGAGKTSLLRRLYLPNQLLPTEKDTTKGISIYRHEFELKNGRRFRLNVWDFGGQEIYHATHQFFLTRRSLYVLVDDTRKDQKSVSDEGFKYWLELIDVFGGHSSVLIFQNEKGGRSKAIDIGGIKGRYDNVKECYAGNLEHGDAAERLHDGIEFFASNLSHIGEELPARWIKVRADIEIRAGEVPYVSQQEYFQIYERHMDFDRSKALHLSRYLHDLGVFLHFQDDSLLARTVILQNQWATEAVFRILDDETVKAHHGRFNAADCERLWRDSAYADMHPELLALMKRFELCYELRDSKPPTWLTAQLLPPAKPTQVADWGRPEDLVLRFRYDFLPKGVISRLTVRLHRFVRSPEKAWVTGVLFEHDHTELLVELLANGSEIELRARGPERKALLSVIAADLDALNDSFEGLREKVDKSIPCNCKLCCAVSVPHFFAQRSLLRRKEDKRLNVECPISYEDVDVLGLLDGIRMDKLPGWASAEPVEAPVRTIRIFLASSAELTQDRNAFDLYFRQQNDQLRKRGLYLEIVRWENFLDAMSETRLQDEYNKEIRACDIFVCLFFTKTGKFTEEEFDIAHAQFKDSGKPRIYTYFKNADVKTGSARKEDFVSLWGFQEKLTNLGHYYTHYDNIEHLKRQFGDQIDKMPE